VSSDLVGQADPVALNKSRGLMADSARPVDARFPQWAGESPLVGNRLTRLCVNALSVRQPTTLRFQHLSIQMIAGQLPDGCQQPGSVDLIELSRLRLLPTDAYECVILRE